MSSRRATDTVSWCLHAGVVGALKTPTEISFRDILRAHTKEYITSLSDPETLHRISGVPDQILSVESLWTTTRLAVGGTLAAARWSLNHRSTSANALGGFHHAARGAGGGFCMLNDVTTAIEVLRAEGLTGRIGIIDLDAHPPDGIAQAELEDVVIYSISSDGPFPYLGGPHVDLRLPTDTSDETYLKTVNVLLNSTEPAQLWFYLAGADPLKGDRLGGLAVSDEGLRKRDAMVLAHLSAPTVLLPAGGYHPQSWRVFANTLAVAAGLSVRPPFDHTPARIWAEQKVDGIKLKEESWLTPADLFALGAPAPPRFLGRFSRHHLEQILEQFGVLDTLQDVGFRHLTVSIEDRVHDRMLVKANLDGEPKPLIDLACAIEHNRPEGKVLFVHWLELTDPRVTLTHLPGQQRSGLGLATEIQAMLEQLANKLGCDAVGFTPAHFHVAWVSRREFVFVDGKIRGVFRALTRSLSVDGDLARVSQIVSEGKITTACGQPVTFDTGRAIKPLTERASLALAQGDAQAAATEAAVLRALSDATER